MDPAKLQAYLENQCVVDSSGCLTSRRLLWLEVGQTRTRHRPSSISARVTLRGRMGRFQCCPQSRQRTSDFSGNDELAEIWRVLEERDSLKSVLTTQKPRQ